MKNIFGCTKEYLEGYFLDIGEKKYKAKQIFDHLYKKKNCDITNISNIKKDTIEKMNNDFSFDFIKICEIKKGKDVKKYLFKLNDNDYIEAVLMFHDYGNSLCISTQVGCNMGCAFCESGRLKKRRNLDTYEMVEQILLVEKCENIRISHVVLMGIGEPFDNYDNVINFIKIINDDLGLAIGARHITVSTCGIIPKIEEFTKIGIQVNLAISLHAPTNELRDKLMPINKIYNLNDLMIVLKKYSKITNRRITFEYILLKDINDTKECAIKLCALIKGMNAYVNLIPYNETENFIFKRSNTSNINAFYDILKKNGINVTIRREFGGLIDAACGQLRANKGGK